MHKNTLWLIFAILCIYFSLVLCENSRIVQELSTNDSSGNLKNNISALQEEARTKRIHRYHLHSLWGFYGLAIAYLVKVKIVVVAFFVGSAVYLGLRYLWPHKCAGSEFYKEGSIILDHPPPSFAHHDHHIPYSLDHDHDHHHNDHYNSDSFTSSGPSSFDPYSAYASHTLSEAENSFPSGSFTGPDGAPEALHSDAAVFRRKRSEEPKDLKQEMGALENLARQMVVREEQIGEFMLSFLGLDTIPCRRRFICEMEFKSKRNPLTSMAFRIVGRSFFAKYINNQNPLREASSFEECAVVNAECLFVENNEEADQDTTNETPQTVSVLEEENWPVTPESSLENNDISEEANENNLRAELNTSLRKRLRGHRYAKLI